MLKGGQALRTRGVSNRATGDLDMRSHYRAVEHGVDAAIFASRIDIGDGIFFDIASGPRPLAPLATRSHGGYALSFTATIGGEPMARVSIDLVTGCEPSGLVLEAQRPLAMDIPGTTPVRMRVYPVEDHIADKTLATLTTFNARPSSRVGDLYNLCAFALRSAPSAAPLSVALEEERVRRGLDVATSVVPPNEWSRQWPTMFVKYPDDGIPHSLADAARLAQSLVDPVLSQAVTTGAWNSKRGVWTTA